jgi:hypothetical protein
MLIAAGISFLLLLVVEFLSHSQALEYVHVHFPALYTFLVSRDTLAALGFVGLTLVFIVAWELKQVKEQATGTPQAVQESAAAAKASIGDINIHLPISTHHTTPPATERLGPVKPVEKPKKRVVVFGPVKFEWLKVVLKENQVRSFEINNIKASGGGLLLPIYNDPTQSDVDIEYARAHIVFTDKDTGEKIIVAHAWWIGERLEEVHLPLGLQKYVLVVAADKVDGPLALENAVRRDVGTRYEYNEQVIKEHALHGLLYRVDVTLIHGGNSEFRDSYSFDYRTEDLGEEF